MTVLTPAPLSHATSSDLCAPSAASVDWDLFARVTSFPDPGVCYKLRREHGMETDAAEQIYRDALLFLFICGTEPDGGGFTPTRQIDIGWHEFILFTHVYDNQFCIPLFGRKLHHCPYVPGRGMQQDSSGPRRTLEAAIAIVGADALSDNWIYRNPKGDPVIGPHVMGSAMSGEVSACNNNCSSCNCQDRCCQNSCQSCRIVW